jgi:ABC-type glycerol-3-phosphate transport system substrate-binding protein
MTSKMKKLSLAIAATVLLGLGVAVGANSFNAPTTILHVSTVQWKADSTPAQQQAALDGIKKMAAEVPGIKNVWIKKVKVQPAAFSTVFAIEFESKAAFDAYTNHPAHKAWEKVYLPIREESQTQDVTN